MAFRHGRAVFLGDRLVMGRIEDLPFGGDGFHAMLFEKILELLLDHGHALDDRGGIGGGTRGLQAQLEVVQDGKQLFQEAGIRVSGRLFFVADGALAVVVEFGLGAKSEVLEPGRLGLKIRGFLRGGNRFLRRIRGFVPGFGFVFFHVLAMAIRVMSSCWGWMPTKVFTSSATYLTTLAAPCGALACRPWTRRGRPYSSPSWSSASVAPSV